MNIKTCVRVPSAVLVGILTALGLTACGGGSSSTTATTTDTTPTAVETITGQFIDAAVAGLAYSCSSGSTGVTDSNGIYTCNMGDTVTFSINGFVIGSATASKLITPYTLAAAATADTTQATTIAINIAQLLQTLDDDNDPSNGISIAQSGTQYAALATMATDNITLTLGDFDTTVAEYIGETLVDETTAQTHLADSVAVTLKEVLAGKSLHPEKTPPYWEEWVFAADGLSGTASGEDEAGYWEGSFTISYDAMSFTVTPDIVDPNNPPLTVQVTAIMADYIQTDLGKIYFTFNAASIKAALSGATLYPAKATPAHSEKWTIAVDGLSGTAVGVDDWGAWSGSHTISYADGSFTVISGAAGDPPVTFQVTAITDKYIQTTVGGIYHTQPEAYTDAIVAAFAGKKLYPQQTATNFSEEWAFNEDATVAAITGVDEFGAFTGTATFGYVGATFTATSDTDPTKTFTVLDILPHEGAVTNLLLRDEVGNEFGVYYTQADAYVGL